MRFQTFIAPNLSKAKEQVRAALGEDAIIIATRDAPGGGVEIRAAAAPNGEKPPVHPALERPALNTMFEKKHAEETFAQISTTLASRERTPLDDNSGDAVFEPVTEEDQLFYRNFSAALAHHGLGEPLLRALAAPAGAVDTDDNVIALTAAFREVFEFAPLELTPVRPIILLGPTGAGKTSSAAKLAARAMVHGGRVTLMSADVGRAGAIEQIKTYADALETDFQPIESPRDVERMIRTGVVHGSIVIDTPGISPFDGADMAALRSLMEAARAEPVLVLPAMGDADEHRDWALAFQDFRVQRCIITKFDAARRVGSALGAAHAAGYALAHFSDAAFIADGLRDATADFAAARLLSKTPGRLPG